MLYERLCCADFRPASIFCAVGNKLLKSHREYLNQSEALDGPSIKWNKEGAPSKQEEKGKGRYHGPMLQPYDTQFLVVVAYILTYDDDLLLHTLWNDVNC